jgi:hypothetical protein
VSDFSSKEPVGYQQLTVSSTAVGLTVPIEGGVAANLALIRVATAAVRWRDDGTNPTASVGMPLAVDDTLVYDGQLVAAKFIRKDAADATLDIAYYRAGRR